MLVSTSTFKNFMNKMVGKKYTILLALCLSSPKIVPLSKIEPSLIYNIIELYFIQNENI